MAAPSGAQQSGGDDISYFHNWEPAKELADDENWMDLVMIATRSSQLRQGGMACVLTRPGRGNLTENGWKDALLAVATNQSIYSDGDSDVHAEIVALGQVAQHATKSTTNATAYITMPPCPRCFAALVVAGVRRIVSRYPCLPKLQGVAATRNVELVVMDHDDESAQQRVREFVLQRNCIRDGA